MLIDGRQIKDGSISAAKFVAGLFAGLLRADGTVPWTGNQNAGGQVLTNLGAPAAATDAARLQDVQSIPWKAAVRAATAGNIALTGIQTIDGVALIAGDRCLVKNQTTGSQNGIYIVAAGAWSRSTDCDSAIELQSCVVCVNEGTVGADTRWACTTDSITLGTTALTFVNIGFGPAAAFDVTTNKAMTASVTSADNQIACATALGSSPGQHAYVRVMVNGVGQVLGDGVKTKDCYFSADSGVTAKSFATIAAGDSLYWVGSIAGFQLAATDLIDFDYAT